MAILNGSLVSVRSSSERDCADQLGRKRRSILDHDGLHLSLAPLRPGLLRLHADVMLSLLSDASRPSGSIALAPFGDNID
jgi:hypothetical protein